MRFPGEGRGEPVADTHPGGAGRCRPEQWPLFTGSSAGPILRRRCVLFGNTTHSKQFPDSGK